jgi:putative two-component system response regulator
MMKQHCTIGAETLGAALRQHPHAGFLEMARDIAMHHHERYDGKGYPARLAGDAIPLSARIVALADVYDALTSQRAYKGAQMHVVARGIIMGERGRHFDPVVCDAFLACEREFERIRAEHSDAPKSGGGPARRRARP